MLRNYNGVIVCNCSGAGGGTFAGGGGAFTSMLIEGAGTYALIISGSNTFTGAITVDRSVASKIIRLTAGTTQTMANFVCAVSGIRSITFTEDGVGTNPILTKTGGGTIFIDYINLSDNTGSPANTTWWYGLNSTIGAGVVGWGFCGVPPAGAEIVGIVDSAVRRMRSAYISANEVIGITDTVVKMAIKAIAETVGLTDTFVRRLWSIRISTTEVIGILDSHMGVKALLTRAKVIISRLPFTRMRKDRFL
jgi:autotransporter-associated beta strand protein